MTSRREHGRENLLITSNLGEYMLASQIKPTRRFVSDLAEACESFFLNVQEGFADSVSYENPMGYIESTIDKLEAEYEDDVTLYTTWDPTIFAREMDALQSLRSMITFTGSVDASWATTCEEYMEYTWPKTWTNTLDVIQTIMKSGCSRHIPRDKSIIEKISQAGRDSVIEIPIRGRKSIMVQTAQQIAWMMSALRTQEDTDLPIDIYSECRMEALGKGKYLLEQRPLQVAPASDASCWLPMLNGSVIAYGFPIPAREGEVGVEISIAGIYSLASIQYPVYTEDVVFLKGWSTLIYPVQASEDFKSIQWHMVKSDNPNDVRLKPNRTLVSEVPNWKDVGLDSIRESRSFIGYCRNADIHIGTSSFDPQDPLKKSGASSARPRRLWRDKITVSMAPNVMGAGGLGVSGEIGLHRKARAKRAESNDFDRVLADSAITPVIMYDVSACTGWLVPEISTALHLTCSWLLTKGRLTDSEIRKIPWAPISEDGGSNALETIVRNKKLKFTCGEDGSTWKFYGIIEDAVRALRACRDTQYLEESSESESWLHSWFNTPKLYGWDIADLMEARDSTPRREISIPRRPKDKWLSHVANHPDILVLFCSNIKPPIEPAQNELICQNWNPVPSGRNYLVASVHSLKDLAYYCGGAPVDLRKLTETCFWTQPAGSDPWGLCDYQSELGCERLQRLGKGPSNRTTGLCEGGAVVFGVKSPPREKCRCIKVSNSGKGVAPLRRQKDRRQSEQSAESTEQDSQSEEVVVKTTRKGKGRAKLSQQGLREPVKNKEEQSSSPSYSALSSSDQEDSSDESEASSQERTAAAKEKDSDGILAKTRAATSPDQEFKILAKALAELEGNLEKGWHLCQDYKVGRKGKRDIEALMDEISATVDFTLEKLDCNV